MSRSCEATTGAVLPVRGDLGELRDPKGFGTRNVKPQLICHLVGITTVRLNVEKNQLVNVFGEFSFCIGCLKSA